MRGVEIQVLHQAKHQRRAIDLLNAVGELTSGVRVISRVPVDDTGAVSLEGLRSLSLAKLNRVEKHAERVRRALGVTQDIYDPELPQVLLNIIFPEQS